MQWRQANIVPMALALGGLFAFPNFLHAEGTGIELELRGVSLQQAGGTSARFENMTIKRDGSVHGNRGNYRIAYDKPVTGYVLQLTGSTSETFWYFSEIETWLDDTLVQFQAGNLDLSTSIMTGKEGVVVRNARMYVTAETGTVNLKTEAAKVFGNVRGLVTPQ